MIRIRFHKILHFTFQLLYFLSYLPRLPTPLFFLPVYTPVYPPPFSSSFVPPTPPCQPVHHNHHSPPPPYGVLFISRLYIPPLPTYPPQFRGGGGGLGVSISGHLKLKSNLKLFLNCQKSNANCLHVFRVFFAYFQNTTKNNFSLNSDLPSNFSEQKKTHKTPTKKANAKHERSIPIYFKF